MKTRIEIPPEVEAHIRAIGNQVAIVIPSGSKVIFRHDDGTAETLTLSTGTEPQSAGMGLAHYSAGPHDSAGASGPVEINPLVVAQAQLADAQALSEKRRAMLKSFERMSFGCCPKCGERDGHTKCELRALL